MPVTKKNDPKHKRDKGNSEDLLLIGSHFQNFTAASGITELPSEKTPCSSSRSGTGVTSYKVEVPPAEKEDFTCLIVVTITGSISGIVQAEWQAFSIDGLFCNAKALADGTLFSSLCQDKANLNLESSEKVSPLKLSTSKNGSADVTIKIPGGRIEKSAAFSCVKQVENCFVDFNVTANGSVNTNLRNCENSIAFSSVTIKHDTHIAAYHVCNNIRFKVFEWKNGKYIFRSRLDEEFKTKKHQKDITKDQLGKDQIGEEPLVGGEIIDNPYE